MEFLVELAHFVEADPVGDRVKALLLELAKILELAWHEEADVLKNRLAAGLSQPVVLLTRRVPAQRASWETEPKIYVISEFLAPEDFRERPDLVPCSSVTLPFELMIAATHPKFREVSNAIVKPLISLKREIPAEPRYSLAALVAAQTWPRFVDDAALKSCLLVLDVQPKIVNYLPIDAPAYIARVCKAVESAHRKNWPIVVTEQVPEKLGSTDPQVLSAARAPPEQQFSKASFSAYSHVKDFDHVVVTGIETQICVLLTTAQLLKRGKKVTLLTDTLASGCPDSDWTFYSRFVAPSTHNGGLAFLAAEKIFD